MERLGPFQGDPVREEPVDVVARGSSFLQDRVQDVVFVDLRFRGGRMAHVHVSWLDPHKLRKFTGWYTHGVPHGRELRQRIQELPDVPSFLAAVEAFFDRLDEAA